MKRLTLIRHAKSDWDSGATTDFDRPLNRRGNKAAALMGARILARGTCAELLISSPARRAIETVQLLAQELEIPKEEIVFQKDIYDASLATLIELLHGFPAQEHIALIGHNPGLSDLGVWLCPQAPGWLPTCGVLELKLSIDFWSAAESGCATLLYYDYPKKKEQSDIT